MKKVVENFICEVCGEKIIGTGTTDHCPECLWGKHVDEEIPGDRLSDCKGLMKPIRSSYRKSEFRIYYKCQSCNHSFCLDAAKNDNRDLLIELSAE